MDKETKDSIENLKTELKKDIEGIKHQEKIMLHLDTAIGHLKDKTTEDILTRTEELEMLSNMMGYLKTELTKIAKEIGVNEALQKRMIDVIGKAMEKSGIEKESTATTKYQDDLQKMVFIEHMFRPGEKKILDFMIRVTYSFKDKEFKKINQNMLVKGAHISKGSIKDYMSRLIEKFALIVVEKKGKYVFYKLADDLDHKISVLKEKELDQEKAMG